MNKTGAVWVIIGLVILALLFYFALNRPSGPDEADQPMPVNEAQVGTSGAMEQTAARAEARAELAALQARAEAGETYEELAADFTRVRANLALAYRNAEGEAAQEWQRLSAGFEEFETSVRSGTSDLLDSFADLIDRFSANVDAEAETEVEVQ